MLRRALAGLALLVALAAAATADAAGSDGLWFTPLDPSGRELSADERPSARSSVTLRRVLADAARLPGRSLPDAAGEAEALSPDFGESALAIYALIDDGPREYLAVSAAGWAVLAQTAPSYRLIDALFVQTDPGGTPALAQTLRLAPGRPGLLIRNAHANSQEGFADHHLLAEVDGRLQPVSRGPMLYSVTQLAGGCEPLSEMQELSPLTLREKRDRPADVILKVVETRTCERPGRPPRVAARSFAARLVWDTARQSYRGGLTALEARNQRRIGE
ncbi:MAG TPA: hypothetical protein VEA79_15540 [Phenylobacterium sp.]|nr:hypothetical protein [Phenylobacterium sp.]